MKVINLFIISLLKLLELLFTLLVGIGIMWQFRKIWRNTFKTDDNKEFLPYDKNITAAAVGVIIVFWYFTIVHNNILTNLRLKTKIFNGQHFLWRPVNWCICKRGLNTQRNGMQYFCQDRCTNKFSLVKILTQIAVCGAFYWHMLETTKKCKYITPLSNDCNSFENLGESVLMFGL